MPWPFSRHRSGSGAASKTRSEASAASRALRSSRQRVSHTVASARAANVESACSLRLFSETRRQAARSASAAANRSVSSTRRVVRLDRVLRRFVTCSTRAWRVNKQAFERAAPPRHRTISVQRSDTASEPLLRSWIDPGWLYEPWRGHSSPSRARRLGPVDASPRLPRARGRALGPLRGRRTSGRVKHSDNKSVAKPPAKAQTLREASSDWSSVDLDRRASLDLLLHHSLRYAAAIAACKGRQAS